MPDFSRYALTVPEILLPGPDVDLTKWAVVACDQYTAQPEYWMSAKAMVGDAPSTLHMIYPEAWLKQGDARVEEIQTAMRAQLRTALTRRVDGFVLVERSTESGARLGLMVAVDLEAYDYAPASSSLIRATEGTILDRIPPRVKVREDADLELSHVLMLIDDPGMSLIEPLWSTRADFDPLYDVQLMMGGGRLRGWRVPGITHPQIDAALAALAGRSAGMMYAVGDGNHSLAAARAHWLNVKPALAPEARASHPARYALVELTNLHSPALKFEPIHRALFGVDGAVVLADLAAELVQGDRKLTDCSPTDAMFTFVGPGGRRPLRVEGVDGVLPLSILQPFLDRWLKAHPEASIDYVHGEEVLASLATEGACGFLLKSIDKGQLFSAVRRGGPLPRKAFSMGRASEKRYYMECRCIKPAEA